MPGQHFGVTLAGHNRPHDRLPGHAHHVGEHLGQLQVHLHQRLLHALHPVGLFGEQHFALTHHRAHHTDLIPRPPSRAPQPEAHTLLHPLAAFHPPLPPRPAFHPPPPHHHH